MKLARETAKIILGILIWAAFIFVFLFTANVVLAAEQPENPYQGIVDNAGEQDWDDLEQVCYWESVRAGAPFETTVAVVETIFNRCLPQNIWFPNSPSKVIRQKRQFSTVRKFNTQAIPEMQYEEVSDAISEVVNAGRRILPYDDYVYFDMRKWSWGKDWIWVGATDANGNPIKGKGMWFGRAK